MLREKLQNNLLSFKNNDVWKVWKSNFKSTNCCKQLNVNNLKNDANIANYLADNFKLASNPNDGNKDLEFKTKYFLNKEHYTGSSDAIYINVEMVSKAINDMCNNKAPGHDSLTIEHIRNNNSSFFSCSYFVQIV